MISPPISSLVLLPEMILLAAGCAALGLGLGWGDRGRRLVPVVGLVGMAAGLLATLGSSWWLPVDGSVRLAGSGLAYGSISVFVRIAALEVGLLLMLANWAGGRREERGEFVSMLLFSLAGLMLVGAADNLFVLFLSLELVSIPTYVMVVLSRRHVAGLEAGTKYFYLGALSAAMMAYGFSFLYGVSGSASLSESLEVLVSAVQQPASLDGALAIVGLGLSLGGLLFKIAAVPLHFYIADVYQGASSGVAGVLGFVPKAAGMVAILRLVECTGCWDLGSEAASWLLWLVAVASMCVGNVLALRQANLKRMLAYSGVAHAGYMLVGVLAGPQAGDSVVPGGFGMLGDGVAGVLYYLVIYGIANLAAFAVLGLLRVQATGSEEGGTAAAFGGHALDRPCETLRDVAGLLRREPVLALLLSLALFTLMGLPPTPGFWGKLSLFGSALAAARAADDQRMIVLVVIAVLNSALAAAYYLRAIAAVLLYDNDRPAIAASREAQRSGVLICGFLLLVFAAYPTSLLAAGRRATADLRSVADVAVAPIARIGR